MLIKCETKSSRVKGLSFHPQLPWILASLHNGTIQLWDYRMGSLLDRFEEHTGPVRSVDFHLTQPLFVSGGDDYHIKVWNYRQRRCNFTLLGHLDYVRTVQFHPNHPWILSASDDQTVRIWNWQSRSCIAILTGHNHYVMCAQFHPSKDLIVSASLDQIIRLWDISGLRSISSDSSPSVQFPSHVLNTSNVTCRSVFEGHDRGVNWVTFHPKLSIVISAADDRLIKIWRYGSTRCWEVDTLRGHYNNVSSVLYLPNKDLILSNSEDKTVRVWDMATRTAIHTYKRENDRFWIITAHPSNNLIGVGHDTGMVVFKLNRERPAMKYYDSCLFYVWDRALVMYNIHTKTVTQISDCSNYCNALNTSPKQLLYNTHDTSQCNILLIHSEKNDLPCELISFQFRDKAKTDIGTIELKSFTPINTHICFVARNRYAILEKPTSVVMCDLTNEIKNRIELPFASEKIFGAGLFRVLLKTTDNVYIYDLKNKRVVGMTPCHFQVRKVVWSADWQLVALFNKDTILLSNSKLQHAYSVVECIRVKSGTWDDHGVFIYSTLTHLKYCLPDGSGGIIQSLMGSIYIYKVAQQTLYYLDREGTSHADRLDCHEYMFKVALLNRQYDRVALFIKNGRLCGNALIGYLNKNGYSEVAMQFVQDPMTRFNLALDHGRLEDALQSAKTIGKTKIWKRLGEEALRRGHYHIVEMVYQKNKAYASLSFLYLISGNIMKLRKMLSIAVHRQDVMSTLHNSMYLGDVEGKVRIFSSSGLLPLAALTARAHGLDHFYEELESDLDTNDIEEFLSEEQPKLLFPPIPIQKLTTSENTNWPTFINKGKSLDDALEATKALSAEVAQLYLEPKKVDVTDTKTTSTQLESLDEPDDLLETFHTGDGWQGLDDALLMVNDDGLASSSTNDTSANTEQLTMEYGISQNKIWTRRHLIPAVHVAAGEFTSALSLLRSQIGLKNASPLIPLFTRAYQSVWCSVPGLPLSRSMYLPITSDINNEEISNSINSLPLLYYDTPKIVSMIKLAKKHVTDCSWDKALVEFRQILQALTLSFARDQEERKQLTLCMETCRSYITAMRIQIQNTNTSSPVSRASGLWLITCCKLAKVHEYLFLRQSIATSFSKQNYKLAEALIHKLINGNFMDIPNAKMEIQKANTVLERCKKLVLEEEVNSFDYLYRETGEICTVSLSQTTAAHTLCRCPFCNSIAKQMYSGQLCDTCSLSNLGEKGLAGLRNFLC